MPHTAAAAVQVAVSALIAAFDDSAWTRTMPAIATSMTGMGASKRGALLVCSCLETALPRQHLLRQRAAADVLLGLPFCKVPALICQSRAVRHGMQHPHGHSRSASAAAAVEGASVCWQSGSPTPSLAGCGAQL